MLCRMINEGVPDGQSKKHNVLQVLLQYTWVLPSQRRRDHLASFPCHYKGDRRCEFAREILYEQTGKQIPDIHRGQSSHPCSEGK